MELTGHWNYPTAITVGAGCIIDLAETCIKLGMTKPLFVTDPTLAKLPMVQDATAICRNAGLDCDIFSDIKSNPTVDNVEAGIVFYCAGGFDGVIALGGGSSIDIGKTIALMAGQLIRLWDLEDNNDNWTRANPDKIAPIIAIPTTAGTGSEVGRAAVITDTRQLTAVKRIIFHPKMLPAYVFLDPELTLDLPPSITAATGLDALSHNLEAYCAPNYHPMAEGIAIEAIRLIKNNLPLAFENGKNVEARTQMLVASSMGATAFQRGLGGMHALAHSVGARYNQHHGLLNGILLPYVLVMNRPYIEERITRLACYLQLSSPSFESFLTWIIEFKAQLNIPATLGEIDIDIHEADVIAAMSVADPAAAGNPVLLTQSQYEHLFICAVKGDLACSL